MLSVKSESESEPNVGYDGEIEIDGSRRDMRDGYIDVCITFKVESKGEQCESHARRDVHH